MLLKTIMNDTTLSCFVLNCPNSCTNNTATSFHRFPEELQSQWLIAIGRKRDTFLINEVVCSIHFKNTDFEDYDGVKLLKQNIIPSLNLPEQGSYFGTELDEDTNEDEEASGIETDEHTEDKKIEDSGSRSMSNDKQYHVEYDIQNCRTCLCEIGSEGGYPFSSTYDGDKTLKELIAFCIPQIYSNLQDDELVCEKCLESIKFCVSFIENCLKVENELFDKYQETLITTIGRDNILENATDIENRVKSQNISLDHSYLSEPEPLSENTEDFQETIIIINQDTEKHECQKCNRSFRSRNYLLDHIRKIHVNKSLTKHKKSDFDCQFCDKFFMTKVGYDLHFQLSHRSKLEENKIEEEGYSWEECRKQFVAFSDMSEHKIKKHECCNVCEMRFDTEDELKVHLGMHPNNYICETCGKGYCTRAYLSAHKLTHRETVTHLCDQCGECFKSEESLRLHINHHKPELKFKCNECPATFQKRFRLESHKKVRHLGTVKYTCMECNKSFCDKSNMQSHYRLKHLDVRPFACDNCGQRFARVDYLKRHKNCAGNNRRGWATRKYRKIENDNETVTCNLCNKVVKDVTMLRLHIKTHVNIREYKCRVCNLTFTTSSNRNRHEKVHKDNSGLFRCDACFVRTVSKEELDKHITITHRNAYKYQCRICQETFFRKYLMNSHMVEKHGGHESFEQEKEVLSKMVLQDYLLTNEDV